jgi:hypothetical protein
MTSTFYGAFTPAASVVEIDETVVFNAGAFHVPPVSEATVRIVPPPRRPHVKPRFEERRSFGYVGSRNEPPLLGIDPAETGALPLAVQALIDREQDAARRRRMARGRHRSAVQPGLFARLLRGVGFRRGRRDSY